MLGKSITFAGGLTVVGALMSLVLWAASLEPAWGLSLLFRLRGRVDPPPDVAAIAIDGSASAYFGDGSSPGEWPRSRHAELVRKLVRAGVRAIAFDLSFARPSAPPRDAEDDRRLAEALAEAGRVVLLDWLEPCYPADLPAGPPPPGAVDRQVEETLEQTGCVAVAASRPRPHSAAGLAASAVERVAHIERHTPPIAPLAEAAAMLAPFPLSDLPGDLWQFWVFKPEAGDMLTLPAAALVIYAAPYYARLLTLLGEAADSGRRERRLAALHDSGDWAGLNRVLRELFRQQPLLAESLLKRVAASEGETPLARGLRALVGMYHGPATRYLNYYGPPRTVKTISYHCLFGAPCGEPLDSLERSLAGRAVFVGYGEPRQPHREDEFSTVYSQADGTDLRGVEIGATAFANLLAGRSLTPLSASAQLLALTLWGVLLAVMQRGLAPFAFSVAALTAALACLGLASYAFAIHAVLLPFIVPIFIQVPVAMVWGALWSYTKTRRERERIQAEGARMRQAFGHYLPAEVIDELVQRSGGEIEGRIVHGVCLYTDAERYTALSERLAPQELHAVLNRYYATLFEPVRNRGGFISDVVGDAMLALWAAAGADPRQRRQSCEAALEILSAESRGRLAGVKTVLPTRIGLHCGKMVLGNVGAGGRYEYRAVGDIVNTAQRIEMANKSLGTRLLASAEVLEGLETLFLFRELGCFALPGKHRPMVLYEVLDTTQQCAVPVERRCLYFAAGLAAFQTQDWDQAHQIFQRLLGELGDDGPARFYLRLCEEYRVNPPAKSWDGSVRLAGVLEAPASLA
ncbi:MAG: CHASE2 domain-containing protein [Gammaproteobacteria bacterium]